MKKILTEKQKKLLEEIKKYSGKNRIPPSVRELAELLGHKSTSTTHAMIVQLEEKGYIYKDKNSARSIVIIE